MSAAYVRRYYGVTYKRGDRVTVDGKPGVIVSFPDQYLGVRFDGVRGVARCHPKWRVELGEPEPFGLLDLLARRPELRDVGIAGYLVGAAVDGGPGMPPEVRVAFKYDNARLQAIAAQIKAGEDISVDDLEYLREFFQVMAPRFAEFNRGLVKAVRRVAGEMGRLVRGAA